MVVQDNLHAAAGETPTEPEILDNILGTLGNPPLVRLNRIARFAFCKSDAMLREVGERLSKLGH